MESDGSECSGEKSSKAKWSGAPGVREGLPHLSRWSGQRPKGSAGASCVAGQRQPVQRPCGRSRLGVSRKQQEASMAGGKDRDGNCDEIREHGGLMCSVRTAAYTPTEMGAVGGF